MATSRRTGTNEQISTYGTAGRDYTSLDTWEAATDIDLVTATQSEVLECYDDAAEFDDNVGMAGATTNASYFRIIRPAGTIGDAGWQGHDGTPNNGFKIHNTAGSQQAIDINEAYSSAQDIIIQQTNPDSSTTPGLNADGGFNLLVGMILVDITSGDGTARGVVLQGEAIAVNCISIRVDTRGFLADNDASDESYYLNCTAIDCDVGFEIFSGALVYWINCLADGSISIDFGTTATVSQNNASSDGTATGTGSRTNQTFTFVNAGNDDYHLASNDAGARTFGQDLSAYGVFAFDDDIDGQLRS